MNLFKKSLQNLLVLRLLPWFFGLSSLEALISLVYLLLIPADPGNALLLGYSAARLTLLAILLLAFGVTTWLALRSIHPPAGLRRAVCAAVERPRWFTILFTLALLIAGLGSTALLTPTYRLGALGAAFDRLRPLILWVALSTTQATLLLLTGRFGLHPGNSAHTWKAIARPASLAALLLAALWGTIAISRLGLTPDAVHWNETGVPILTAQVLVTLSAAGLTWLVERAWRPRRAWLDVLIFLAIWGLAAAMWVATPQPRSFFAPGPYPPNGEFYPFSDAANYDLAAQYALAGQRLGNGLYVDKPLYSTFLLGLHLLAGQRMGTVTALQAGLLALLPALVFLLGKKNHSRPAAVMAALLVAFYGANTLPAALYIQDSNPRLVMSEFPLALLLALFSLWLARWLRHPHEWLPPLLAGGALGLAALVRHNVWLLPPFVALAILPVYWRRMGRWLLTFAVFLAVMLATLSPWMVRTVRMGGPALFFLTPLQSVVLAQRYAPDVPTPAPDATPQPDSGSLPGSAAVFLDRANVIANHFAHNLVAVTLTLPASLRTEDLQHTLRGDLPYWDMNWEGSQSAGQVLLLALNLAILAFGLAGSWRHWKYAGLAPLFTGLTYLLACAVARTSGGRYIVPVNWVVFFYYALGWVQLLSLIASLWGVKTVLAPQPSTSPLPRRGVAWQALILLLVFVSVGATPLAADRLFPVRYPQQDVTALAADLQASGALQAAGLDEASLLAFAASPDAAVLHGTALYPRFYARDEGEPDQYSYTYARSYPRLTFELLGAHGSGGVVLPLETIPGYLPNGSEVVALGCHGQRGLDAWGVIVLNPEGALSNAVMYLRTPSAPLVCPLPVPAP